MKSSVLQRKMFMRPPVKKAEGGILSLVEGDMEEGQDNFEERRPDNIEIIANNLRGDIRSMDERYLELAQMVGDAAFDTPEEVLALMQPQLQQQMAQQNMPPAASAPSPQGMEQITQGPMQQAPGPQGAPGMPMPPQQPPGGIEALVADQGPAAAPQPPMAQAPVQRSQGTPYKEAMAGGEGSFKTGQGLQIDIAGVGTQPISAYRASPEINFGDVSNVRLDAMPPEVDFGVGVGGELEEYLASGGDANLLLKAIIGGPEQKEVTEKDTKGIESLRKKKPSPSDMFAMAASNLKTAGYGRDPQEEAIAQLAEMQRIHGIAGPWVRRRQRGSPPVGEMKEPYLSDVARNLPVTGGLPDPRLGGGVRIPGGYPADDQYFSGEGMSKSRPLSYEELAERVRERENRTLGPRTRRFYEMLRNVGIEPEFVAPKLKSALETLKKIPGVGKVGKVLGKDPLTTGGIAVSGALMAPEIIDRATPTPTPGPGVVPALPALPDGSASAADNIPPVAGTPLTGEPAVPVGPDVPITANRESDEVDRTAMGPLDLTGLADRASDEVDRTALGPIGPSADTQRQPGESEKDFRTRVMERADLYKELLGEDEDARKAKAYFMLAEAGLALAGAKGRNLGERLSVGLKGLPSGMGKLASERTAVDRAATSAAISAIEQEDRDAAKALASLKTAIAKAAVKSPSDRDNKIVSLATVYKNAHGMDDATATQMAKLKVDGALPFDGLGNERVGSTNGQIVVYGPANQPIAPENPAFIDQNYPFQVQNPNRPTPAMDEKTMTTLINENEKLTGMLGQLQRAKLQLSDKIGPLNVLQRGLSKATVPWLGDLGPLRADEATTYVIDDLNKIIRGYKSVNADGGRVSNWEMQNNQSLEINSGSFFTSPAIELRKIIAMEAELINQIQQNKFRLNPRDSGNVYRQIAVPPSGSRNEPIPSNAFSTLGQYFSVMPGTTVYYRDSQGKVHGITKQYYDSQMSRQQAQRAPAQ